MLQVEKQALKKRKKQMFPEKMKVSAGLVANLRRDMYDNVQTFAFSNIHRFSTSSIVTRLTTDATNVQNAYQMLIRMTLRGLLIIIRACHVGKYHISLISM